MTLAIRAFNPQALNACPLNGQIGDITVRRRIAPWHGPCNLRSRYAPDCGHGGRG
jgi:hypothetical protein